MDQRRPWRKSRSPLFTSDARTSAEILKMELSIISTCDDCGACCREMAFPPGFEMMFLAPASSVARQEMMEAPDVRRFQTLPPSAVDELRVRFQAIEAGRVSRYSPCVWFDPIARQCRHYEHRPEICRNFEVGSPACGRWRTKYNVA